MDQSKPRVNLLLAQLKSAQQWCEDTMDGVTDEVANWQPQGTALPIGAIYLHDLTSQDMMLNMILKKGVTLYDTDWKDKTGADKLMNPMEVKDWAKEYSEWAKSVKVDVVKAREYAKAVYTSSETVLESLTEEDLDQELDMTSMGMGKMSTADFLSGMVVGHMHSGMGEISVLKGLQGLKGYPF